MNEDLNGLTSQLHNSSTDQLHQSLRLLVRKIRAQLEVLTKKNKLKEDENEMLKQQMLNLEASISTQTEKESKLKKEMTEFEAKMDAQRQRHSAIESQLLNELNSKRSQNDQIVSKYELQITQLTNNHNDKLKQQQQKIDNLQREKSCIETKIENILKENEALQIKLQKERGIAYKINQFNNISIIICKQPTQIYAH